MSRCISAECVRRAIRQRMREGGIMSWDDAMWTLEELEQFVQLYGGTPVDDVGLQEERRQFNARIRQLEEAQLAIAGLVNAYYDGTALNAAETLKAIAETLGQPMEAPTQETQP